MIWTKKNLPGAKQLKKTVPGDMVKIDGHNPKAAETHSQGKNKAVWIQNNNILKQFQRKQRH